MSVEKSYIELFPFNVIRDEQKHAISFALDAFQQGKKFVVLEMGTGCGKSATGVTIARALASVGPSAAYILTTQKILQQQYVNDFGQPQRKLLSSLKSSSNYCCGHYNDQSCAESRRVISKLRTQLVGTDFYKHCTTQCQYAIDKQQFLDSSIGITNFSYFLAETMYAGKIEPRDLLIIDECHNIEAELGKFVEVTFSEKFARDVLKCRVPTKSNDEVVFKWIKTTYLKALKTHLARLEKTMSSQLAVRAGLSESSKQYELLDKHICKVHRFINSYDSQNWVMNVVLQTNKSNRQTRRFEFKPIDVSPFSHDMLFRFGKHVLMMSATIVDIDVFCRTIGIDRNDVAYLRLPSPFPVENRPIHFIPVGSMSKDRIESTLPALTEAIKMLLEQHAGDKGIIHCTNYRIAQHVFDSIKSDRLLIHSSENRDAILAQHINNDRPTVLVSPSMMEGVDLADDASRFQIVCKVPFPYMGDLVVKKRMTRDRSWYDYMTAKSIIQAMGRSIRNDRDHAVSYILDADWERFLSRNRNMFPSDFLKSLT